MEEKEFTFYIDKPEEYPYGYKVVRHKVRAGMTYDEYLPNLPPEGEWIRSGPLLGSKIIKIIRMK